MTDRFPLPGIEGAELRFPTPEDARLLGKAFADIDPWRRYQFTAEAIAGFLVCEEHGAPRFAVYRDGTLAGALILRTVWLRGPYLQFLGILPEHQNAGLGGGLLNWFEHTAREAGDRNIWVVTSAFNFRAQRFYERQGFTCVATLSDLIADGLAELLLRKKL